MGSLLKIAVTGLGIFLVFLMTGWSTKLDKKIQKEIEKTFETTQFELQMLDIPEEVNAKLPLSLAENLQIISAQEKQIGYVFVGTAPSKTAEFDYLVLFNHDVEVVHAKVLIYREEYGGEIGSKRWLRQFFGMGGNNRVSPDTNIDAISGATISVRSMTLAMDKLFQSIGILQDKEML